MTGQPHPDRCARKGRTGFLTPSRSSCRRLAPLILLALAIAGCSADQQPQASYRGLARPVCSPVDAFGYELSLDRVEGTGPEQLRLSLWGQPEPGAAGRLHLTGSSNSGELMVCMTEDCRPAEAAFVDFEGSPQGSFAGIVSWRSGLSRVSARFDAAIQEGLTPTICG